MDKWRGHRVTSCRVSLLYSHLFLKLRAQPVSQVFTNLLRIYDLLKNGNMDHMDEVASWLREFRISGDENDVMNKFLSEVGTPQAFSSFFIELDWGFTERTTRADILKGIRLDKQLYVWHGIPYFGHLSSEMLHLRLNSQDLEQIELERARYRYEYEQEDIEREYMDYLTYDERSQRGVQRGYERRGHGIARKLVTSFQHTINSLSQHTNLPLLSSAHRVLSALQHKRQKK